MKEEEDGLSGGGSTRLLVQPSCKIYLFMLKSGTLSAQIACHLQLILYQNLKKI